MFVSDQHIDKPLIYEIFTNSKDESDALLSMWSIAKSSEDFIIGKAIDALGGRKAARNILGKNGVAFFRKLLRR